MEDREAIGSWLRAERRARQWDVPEMARQVRKAARDDPHLPVLRDLRRMIRGWEAAEHALSERYQLLYATAFGIETEELFTGTGSRQLVPATGAPIRAQGDRGPNLLVTDSDFVQVESLRQSLHEVLSEHSLTAASLEDWERTVIEHGLATRERPASLMLVDLSADLEELQRALATCRSPAALQRLTRVVLPADVSAEHVAVDRAGEPLSCLAGPLLIPRFEGISPGQCAVLDEEAADVLACW